MHYYSKIIAPFERENAKSKYVTEGKWSKPEFKMLQDIKWSWTQKIDGTNVRVFWNGDKVEIFGHTDKTQFNERTMTWLKNTFCTPEAETVFEDLYGENPVNVFGEFVSKDTNQNYGYPNGAFFVFDVQSETSKCFWGRDAVKTVAERFNVFAVQELLVGSIREAVKFVKIANKVWNKEFINSGAVYGFDASDEPHIYYVENPLGKYPLEGLVGRPYFEELRNNKGERVITKVKCKDFEDL